eukprot:SAG22_NODE_3547_length_1649_cov_4.190323_2_plen_210_part_01
MPLLLKRAGWRLGPHTHADGLIDNYILPLQVAILSPDGKYSDLGLASSVGTVAAFGEAIFGVMSDRSKSRYGGYLGRRRLHILLSAVLSLVALLAMLSSLLPGLGVTVSVGLLGTGFAARQIAAVWGGAPLQALLPECVPSAQRTISGSLSGIFGGITDGVTAVLAVMVGQGLLGYVDSYFCCIALLVTGTVCNIVSFSRRPGWAPEPAP